MKWTQFSKPPGDLGPTDLKAVVENQHEEGLFLEFKERWITSKGVSRAVASFANMPDVGTVIVGIQEDPVHKRRASATVGFAHDSDPPEGAPTNAIRAVLHLTCGLPVDPTGIEPVTSAMPWRHSTK